MDEFLRLQNFQDYLQKQQSKRACKNASSSKHHFCSFHQTHDHNADDCPGFQKSSQDGIESGKIRIVDNQTPSSNKPSSSWEDDIYHSDRLATRIYWRLKYDKNISFPSQNKNKNLKQVKCIEYCIFYDLYSHPIRKCYEFKKFVQLQYDLAHICLTKDLAIFLGKNIVP